MVMKEILTSGPGLFLISDERREVGIRPITH